MKLKKNDVITTEIIDITNLGFGVAKVDGAVIFVSDTVPGDVAKIKIIIGQPQTISSLIKVSHFTNVSIRILLCVKNF